MNHHPDIDIRWNKVTLVQSSHSDGGVTAADFDMVTGSPPPPGSPDRARPAGKSGS